MLEKFRKEAHIQNELPIFNCCIMRARSLSNVMANIGSDSELFLESKSIVYGVYGKTQMISNYMLILWIRKCFDMRELQSM